MGKNAHVTGVADFFDITNFQYENVPIKAPTPSARTSPIFALLPGIKDWWISSDNPYNVEKRIAKINNKWREHLKLRFRNALAIKRPRIEYSAICNNLSPPGIPGTETALGSEDNVNIKAQYAKTGSQENTHLSREDVSPSCISANLVDDLVERIVKLRPEEGNAALSCCAEYNRGKRQYERNLQPVQAR